MHSTAVVVVTKPSLVFQVYLPGLEGRKSYGKFPLELERLLVVAFLRSFLPSFVHISAAFDSHLCVGIKEDKTKLKNFFGHESPGIHDCSAG